MDQDDLIAPPGLAGATIRIPDETVFASYTAARPIAAEGARVGIVTCQTCGAAILLDPDDEVSAVDLHTEWHRRLAGG